MKKPTFERFEQPIVHFDVFLKRQFKFFGLAILILVISLAIGILGYHILDGLNWVDSLLNASMILGGMGPVDVLKNNASKIFASFYAIYSGMVMLTTFGIMITPGLHRFLHKVNKNI